MDADKLKSLLILPEITIKQAMQKLSETQEKILFVIDKKNKLLGTVTDGDIRRGLIKGFSFSDDVKSIMHKKFSYISFAEPEIKEHSKQVMLEAKVEQVPVLNTKGEIIDVILWRDILEESKQLEAKKSYTNQVIIMAGGKGTRLDPFTKILPKPLIPIGNKPIIELIMEKFYSYGFSNFIYTLNYKKEYLKLFLRENKFPYNIDWVEEEDFLGTIGSLSLLKDKIKDSFFVSNCDSLLDVNFANVLKWHKEHKAVITIIGCHNEVKIPFGVLELAEGKVKKIMEKPVQDVIINTGAYVMEPKVISYIPKGKPMDMDKLIDLVLQKAKVSVYPIYSGWFDIGQWEEYKKTVEKMGGWE